MLADEVNLRGRRRYTPRSARTGGCRCLERRRDRATPAKACGSCVQGLSQFVRAAVRASPLPDHELETHRPPATGFEDRQPGGTPWKILYEPFPAFAFVTDCRSRRRPAPSRSNSLVPQRRNRRCLKCPSRGWGRSVPPSFRAGRRNASPFSQRRGVADPARVTRRRLRWVTGQGRGAASRRSRALTLVAIRIAPLLEFASTCRAVAVDGVVVAMDTGMYGADR